MKSSTSANIKPHDITGPHISYTIIKNFMIQGVFVQIALVSE